MIIRGCLLIDCTGREPYQADVRVENGVIAEIGADLSGGDVWEAQGKALLPGLVNLHVHINRRHLHRQTGAFRTGAPAVENASDARRVLFAAQNAWYELSRGITTLRDCCSVGRTATALKQAMADGIIRGPRLHVCGLGIAPTGGHETHRYPGAVEADGPDGVLKAARDEIKHGADFIKLMASGGLGGMPEHEHPDWTEYGVEEIASACSAAHSHNRTVTVHAMGEGPVLNALEGGVDGIEHGAVLSQKALEIMARRNVYYVPTMSGITAVADREEKNGNKALANLMRELVVKPQRESVRKARRHGIMIGAGSDTLGSMPEELLLMEQCGMTPYEAIQTATVNAARILKNADRFGTLEPGKAADLLLLEGNPLEDQRNLSKVDAVFLGGERVTARWMCNLPGL